MVRETTRRQTERALHSTANPRIRKQKAITSRRSNRRVPPTAAELDEQHSYSQQSEVEMSSNPNQKPWLFTLPREVLAQNILGTSSWADERIRQRWYIDLVTHLRPRSLFIELLHRDVQELGLKLCKICNTLHPPVKGPREYRHTELTKSCWGQEATVDPIPPDEDSLSYSFVFDDTEHVAASVSPHSDSPTYYLAGLFGVPHPSLDYTISSFSSRVGGNLVLRHDHRFSLSSSTAARALKAVDVLGSTPLGICPHQTTLGTLPKSRQSKSRDLVGPLFTHSIVSAFPATLTIGTPKASAFRKPTSLEKQMMTSSNSGKHVTHKCHSCPTKWAVEYHKSGRGQLTITVFQCFFEEPYSSSKCWPWFVRREGKFLDEEQRNSEFWGPGRSHVDFNVE
ncbi:hypothetical protein Hte_001305 [Hypoxylon texense]